MPGVPFRGYAGAKIALRGPIRHYLQAAFENFPCGGR
jgi:hypothetical protein